MSAAEKEIDLKTIWKPEEGVPDEPINDSDKGNALRLVAEFGHELRYVAVWGTWLVWDGTRWRRDTRGVVHERAKAIASLLHGLAEKLAFGSDARKQARKHALATEAAPRLEAMVRLARTHPQIATDHDELDTNAWLLNVANGTIDLRTGRLRRHDPRDLITKIADVAYDPDARAPRWQAFLEQVLPDPDVREFVARWAGYCLTGSVREHKVLFAYGTGMNGKGTLWGTLQRMAGDYAGEAAPDLLLRRKDDPHPTGLADLHGRRLVLASETGQDRNLDEPLIKRLSGGDKIKGRKMHKDFFEFLPTHKFVVSTNHRPGIIGTDVGIWRRLRIVPFAVTIPKEDQDQELDEKLDAEAAGILAWAVAGCLRWQHDRTLTEPLAVTLATADYRADMDVLGDFISESCVLVDGISSRAGELYGAYQRWCETQGERPVSQRRLGLQLRERGLQKRTSNGVWWEGIGLRVGTLESSERSSGK